MACSNSKEIAFKSEICKKDLLEFVEAILQSSSSNNNLKIAQFVREFMGYYSHWFNG